MKLNEKIYYSRKKLGMSQEALAEAIGVSRQAVSKWETGDAEPELSKLRTLASVFSVSADWLLSEDEPEADKTEAESGTEKTDSAPDTTDFDRANGSVGTNPYYHVKQGSGEKYKGMLAKYVKRYGWVAGFFVSLPGLGMLAFGGIMKLITSLMFRSVYEFASASPIPETNFISGFESIGNAWVEDVMLEQFQNESNAMLDSFASFNPVTILANILLIAGAVIVIVGVVLAFVLKKKLGENKN